MQFQEIKISTEAAPTPEALTFEGYLAFVSQSFSVAPTGQKTFYAKADIRMNAPGEDGKFEDLYGMTFQCGRDEMAAFIEPLDAGDKVIIEYLPVQSSGTAKEGGTGESYRITNNNIVSMTKAE